MIFLDKDPAIKMLNTILSKTDRRLTIELGADTINEKWRNHLRNNLKHVAARMMHDYNLRKQNHGCDPNGVEKSEPVTDEDLDLPKDCSAVEKPLKILLGGMFNWLNTYNKCGDGLIRHGFHSRMTHRLAKFKRRIIHRAGCEEVPAHQRMQRRLPFNRDSLRTEGSGKEGSGQG